MQAGRGGAVRVVPMPGPVAAERMMAVRAGVVPIRAVLPAGVRLLDGLHGLLKDGLESASLRLSGGGLHPFAYVIPALSPDADHAAYYSETRRPAGVSRLEAGAVTVGFRAGAPFFHCHALWHEADGVRGCGHVMPDETVVAAPITVEGVGLIGARFEVRQDGETGFGLFMPVATGTAVPEGVGAGVALRLAPNQDLVWALEDVGLAAGFGRAVVAGGVASINAARFIGGGGIEGFATELLVRRGEVRCAEGAGEETVVEIAIVDLHGAIGEGRLVAGDNPVLMTFEGVLVEA